ncbi:hypothetical protein NDU88_005142 [Pleurodeles waltl]|uniref:Uncharacterized protein n=1 Tax=Pleurodeles waltl TaxID=8319 RepID=A0AAV7L0C4_PLEWA|nr:hypothetical protein NDU88_005142 [Pleurodeles waltl]
MAPGQSFPPLPPGLPLAPLRRPYARVLASGNLRASCLYRNKRLHSVAMATVGRGAVQRVPRVTGGSREKKVE